MGCPLPPQSPPVYICRQTDGRNNGDFVFRSRTTTTADCVYGRPKGPLPNDVAATRRLLGMTDESIRRDVSELTQWLRDQPNLPNTLDGGKGWCGWMVIKRANIFLRVTVARATLPVSRLIVQLREHSKRPMGRVFTFETYQKQPTREFLA